MRTFLTLIVSGGMLMATDAPKAPEVKQPTMEQAKSFFQLLLRQSQTQARFLNSLTAQQKSDQEAITTLDGQIKAYMQQVCEKGASATLTPAGELSCVAQPSPGAK